VLELDLMPFAGSARLEAAFEPGLIMPTLSDFIMPPVHIELGLWIIGRWPEAIKAPFGVKPTEPALMGISPPLNGCFHGGVPAASLRLPATFGLSLLPAERIGDSGGPNAPVS
jgi:hypothetical protein